MRIAGFQPTSLLDYPDHVSAIVWTQGCNLRCPYCYNTTVVNGSTEPMPQEAVLSSLRRLRGKVEAVVVTGGEPFLHDDLASFCQQVKDLGYLIKVDTNGTRPQPLADLLSQGLLDYVAMDIKAPPDRYPSFAGVSVPIADLQASIDAIRTQAPAYEFRTTLSPPLTKEDVVRIGQWIEGSERYVLQQFKPRSPLLNPAYEQTLPYPREFVLDAVAAVRPYCRRCTVRGI